MNRSSLNLLGLAVLLAALAAPAPARAQKRWREYTDCRQIPNPGNDADSFHVRAGNIKNRTYLFRLYFVDAPESDNSLPERLQVQAEYFGITDIANVVKAGKEATKFTENFLKNGFTVHSRLSDAMGRSAKDRDYAMVRVGNQDLGMELVRQGYGRIHGMETDLSELPVYKCNAQVWWRRLRAAEAEAKREKRGAWAYAGAPASRLDALFAPRQVEEQDVVLSQVIYIYPLENPTATQPLGQLRAGVTVRVLKGLSPSRAHVRFTTSDGTTYEGAANFTDLGL